MWPTSDGHQEIIYLLNANFISHPMSELYVLCLYFNTELNKNDNSSKHLYSSISWVLGTMPAALQRSTHLIFTMNLREGANTIITRELGNSLTSTQLINNSARIVFLPRKYLCHQN